MKKLKIFILNKLTGLSFLIIFCFCSISLFSRSANDPYFGNFSTNQIINNLFGSVGSYFAGTAHMFFEDLSYLIPLFFLVIGFKKTGGIKIGFISIRLFSFIFPKFLIPNLY